MAQETNPLLDEIEQFLSISGMGESYFGKRAAGNSELVGRLRKNGRVWPETAAKVRSFIRKHGAQAKRHGPTPKAVQDPVNGGAS